jgi:large subunit ribosomal protein L21e
MKKVVRNRVEMKRINVRIEHVRPSKCRSDFLARVKQVDTKLREAKKAKIRLPLSEIKRAPLAPKAAQLVSQSSVTQATVTTLKPLKFDDMI